MAWRAKCRVAARPIMPLIRRYIHNFRQRRKNRLEQLIIKKIRNFGDMHKVVRASMILVMKINKIKQNWKIFHRKKQFCVYMNLLKWQKSERELIQIFKDGKCTTDLFNLYKSQNSKKK